LQDQNEAAILHVRKWAVESNNVGQPMSKQHGSDEEQEQMLKLSTTECSTVSGDEWEGRSIVS
jgi:hypothetical protein